MVENTKFQSSYSYAFIDETTKKEIRRKMLKAVCIPGYQVPYSSPEMPISARLGYRRAAPDALADRDLTMSSRLSTRAATRA